MGGVLDRDGRGSLDADRRAFGVFPDFRRGLVLTLSDGSSSSPEDTAEDSEGSSSSWMPGTFGGRDIRVPWIGEVEFGLTIGRWVARGGEGVGLGGLEVML